MRYLSYFLPIILYIACTGDQDPVAQTPGKIVFVPKEPDTAEVERGIDAVPDRDGIYLEWFDPRDPDLRFVDIYRMREGETFFRKIRSIDLESASGAEDTTYTDAPEDIEDYLGTDTEYFLRAVNSDGVEGPASDTLTYNLWDKPVLSRPSGEIITGLPVFYWRFPGAIPDSYILRIREDFTNRLVFVREFQVEEYFENQELDLSSIAEPPEFISGFTYLWRIDSVGPEPLFSGSESQWRTFIAN
jgi:hypothetical protein